MLRKLYKHYDPLFSCHRVSVLTALRYLKVLSTLQLINSRYLINTDSALFMICTLAAASGVWLTFLFYGSLAFSIV